MEQVLEPKHDDGCGWHSDWHNCNCKLHKYLVWVEPGKCGDVTYFSCSAEEAIIRQIRAAESRDHKYQTQEEALEDFIAVNWAIWEGSEKP